MQKSPTTNLENYLYISGVALPDTRATLAEQLVFLVGFCESLFMHYEQSRKLDAFTWQEWQKDFIINAFLRYATFEHDTIIDLASDPGEGKSLVTYTLSKVGPFLQSYFLMAPHHTFTGYPIDLNAIHWKSLIKCLEQDNKSYQIQRQEGKNIFKDSFITQENHTLSYYIAQEWMHARIHKEIRLFLKNMATPSSIDELFIETPDMHNSQFKKFNRQKNESTLVTKLFPLLDANTLHRLYLESTDLFFECRPYIHQMAYLIDSIKESDLNAENIAQCRSKFYSVKKTILAIVKKYAHAHPPRKKLPSDVLQALTQTPTVVINHADNMKIHPKPLLMLSALNLNIIRTGRPTLLTDKAQQSIRPQYPIQFKVDTTPKNGQIPHPKHTEVTIHIDQRTLSMSPDDLSAHWLSLWIESIGTGSRESYDTSKAIRSKLAPVVQNLDISLSDISRYSRALKNPHSKKYVLNSKPTALLAPYRYIPDDTRKAITSIGHIKVLLFKRIFARYNVDFSALWPIFEKHLTSIVTTGGAGQTQDHELLELDSKSQQGLYIGSVETPVSCVIIPENAYSYGNATTEEVKLVLAAFSHERRPDDRSEKQLVRFLTSFDKKAVCSALEAFRTLVQQPSVSEALALCLNKPDHSYVPPLQQPARLYLHTKSESAYYRGIKKVVDGYLPAFYLLGKNVSVLTHNGYIDRYMQMHQRYVTLQHHKEFLNILQEYNSILDSALENINWEKLQQLARLETTISTMLSSMHTIIAELAKHPESIAESSTPVPCLPWSSPAQTAIKKGQKRKAPSSEPITNKQPLEAVTEPKILQALKKFTRHTHTGSWEGSNVNLGLFRSNREKFAAQAVLHLSEEAGIITALESELDENIHDFYKNTTIYLLDSCRFLLRAITDRNRILKEEKEPNKAYRAYYTNLLGPDSQQTAASETPGPCNEAIPIINYINKKYEAPPHDQQLKFILHDIKQNFCNFCSMKQKHCNLDDDIFKRLEWIFDESWIWINDLLLRSSPTTEHAYTEIDLDYYQSTDTLSSRCQF